MRAAAAVGILAIAAPLGLVAVGALRLTSFLLRDQLLMFLALLLAPLVLFAAALAALGLAAGLAVALGVAAGTAASSIWAWGFVLVGAFQVVTYLQVGWNLLAAFTAVATAIEINAEVVRTGSIKPFESKENQRNGAVIAGYAKQNCPKTTPTTAK